MLQKRQITNYRTNNKPKFFTLEDQFVDLVEPFDGCVLQKMLAWPTFPTKIIEEQAKSNELYAKKPPLDNYLSKDLSAFSFSQRNHSNLDSFWHIHLHQIEDLMLLE